MKRAISILLAMMMVLCLFAGCGQSEEAAVAEPEPAEENVESVEIAGGEGVVVESKDDALAEKLTPADTLVIGLYGYTQDSLRPGVSRCCGCDYVYTNLLYEDRTGSEWLIKEELAESYTYEEQENGEWVLHFHLREGALFSNGDEITAEDVVYTIQSIKDTGMGSKVAAINLDKSYTDGNYDVYFVTDTYSPTVIENLAANSIGILCKSWCETATDDDWWDAPVCSGMYTCVENVNGSHILFQVRDDYWGWGVVADRPAYDYLKIVFYAESSTMVVDYENGQVDMCCSLAASDVDRILGEGGMEHSTLTLIPTGTLMSLVFNKDCEALQDLNVRKAINLAVDTASVTAAVASNLGEVCTGYICKGAAGDYFVDFALDTEYDPAAAKALLEEAGYADGDINLHMIIKTTAADQNFATILQAELAEIGIGLEIEEMEQSMAIQAFRNGDSDLIFNLFTAGIYPSVIYENRQSDSSMQPIVIDNEEFQDWLLTGRTTADTDAAHEAYTNAQNYQHDNYVEVPIYEQMTSILYRDYVDASRVSHYRLAGVCDTRLVQLITE